jgi:WD40 repeat protein
MTTRRVTLICIGTISACLLWSCAAAPPETDYRLGERKHTACQAVAVAPTKSYFAAQCDVLVKEDMGGRDYDETVEIISIPQGQLINKTILNRIEEGSGPNKTLAEIEFSPDGSKLAVTTGSGIFRVLDAETLEAFGLPRTPAQKASTLSYAADGEHLAVAFDASTPKQTSHVAIYHVADLQEVQRLVIDSADSILALAFSNDSSKLAVASAEQAAGWARVYDWATGYPIEAIRHKSPVTSVLFSGDDSELLTLAADLKVFDLEHLGGEDGTYRPSSSVMASPGIWAMQQTEVPAEFAHAKPLPRMKLSPDSRFLAVADATDAVNLFVLDPLEYRCGSGVAQSMEGVGYSGVMSAIASLSPYPSDLDWLPDSSLIVASFALGGLQLVGAECVRDDYIDFCEGLRIEQGNHEVELTEEALTELVKEMDRAFFGSGLFERGDLVSASYRVTGHEERNTFLLFFSASGRAKAAVSADFFDAKGEALMSAKAASSADYDPTIDTLGEGMSAGNRLAFRRLSENLAKQAAIRFGCRPDQTR